MEVFIVCCLVVTLAGLVFITQRHHHADCKDQLSRFEVTLGPKAHLRSSEDTEVKH
jgi:hypothetical protein